ncbi:hypothetical protein UA08_05017 [Talaromyces atroroseus]|uniref:Isotrichodermin C-15 hydroxylase n=1 Tax=Talaromyces atroroseus TaxID=1441469 RepID=A0A225AXH7_TALAT|nr:hypothetical protein UA08_05017 [Talaromyces atroroseus]OKL59686.1 hypothetical protein UA08_05017 [Talaromyces atroroseus]
MDMEMIFDHWVKFVGIFAGLFVAYIVGKISYILCFDSLSHIPGPKFNALSMVPYARHLIAGTTVHNTVDLHKKYGDVVRISPVEVSFISGETAFPDIYGFRTGKLKGHLNMEKDPVWYVKPANSTPSLLHANEEDHGRIRRIVSHAFSEKALMAQEGLIQGYVDQLIHKMREVTSSTNNAPVDMVQWYKWIMFDLIADLAFGEPFGCLQDLSTHQYITLLFDSLKSLRFSYISAFFPFLKYLGSFVLDKSLMQKRKDYLQWIASQVRKRTKRNTTRPDFMSYILQNNPEKGARLTEQEIISNASSLIVGGSETTSTLLSGLTWLLLTNPEKMHKLKVEIRGKFKTYDEITINAVNGSPYLVAVITEGLRYYPPIPAGFGRQVNTGGEVISGYYIPEGTIVSVSHYAAYHSERNFKDPDAFVPERWMGDEAYANDNKTACQPFSLGPRGCLGRNLAHAEMRLILAKIVWCFELELEPRSRDWLKQNRVTRHWEKPELAVRLVSVQTVTLWYNEPGT